MVSLVLIGLFVLSMIINACFAKMIQHERGQRAELEAQLLVIATDMDLEQVDGLYLPRLGGNLRSFSGAVLSDVATLRARAEHFAQCLNEQRDRHAAVLAKLGELQQVMNRARTTMEVIHGSPK